MATPPPPNSVGPYLQGPYQPGMMMPQQQSNTKLYVAIGFFAFVILGIIYYIVTMPPQQQQQVIIVPGSDPSGAGSGSGGLGLGSSTGVPDAVIPIGTGGASVPLGTGGVSVPVGTGGATVPVGTGGSVSTSPDAAPTPGDQSGINTGVSSTATSISAPVVLYTESNWGGTARAVLPGQKVQIAYIGTCEYNVPGKPDYDPTKEATAGPGWSNGCSKLYLPTWKYNSMKINPGTKLLFTRSAGIGDGNLGGSVYKLGLAGDAQIYNADDLQTYLQEQGGYDYETLALDRDYWPSPLYLQVVA